MGGPWRLLRALRLRLLGPEKQHVGSDQFGNKYYKIPKHQTWAGQTIPEKRIIEAVNQEEYKYEVGDLPTEWEAWIRKRRKDPPTMELPLPDKNGWINVHLLSWKELFGSEHLVLAGDQRALFSFPDLKHNLVAYYFILTV
ncbi:NADH dehydrogenase [ubiquinone] 1 alpha subcomplex assembly factor 2 isoform X3 [Chelonia mydas]|uniref:NADH dehydrogenase [ubiquinone] 1 alpha subcomplex assembly factor 2 isoform X3 n=1 Tax=Chelonia mydas TaxID=8469 RepID=UPI001CA901F8|nr:NADH dehydrogenase [ubiquinone] 1 alpha subcomplex assembly factor 2 isoform X3 [Chelonia mydas]